MEKIISESIKSINEQVDSVDCRDCGMFLNVGEFNMCTKYDKELIANKDNNLVRPCPSCISSHIKR